MANETSEATVTTVSQEEVSGLIRRHMWGSMGVGLIPLPMIDFAALTGIQLSMLRKIAKMYDVPFFKEKVKNILTPLVGGALPGLVAPGLAVSVTKFIPVLGQAIGVVSMPIVAGASTYAVGKVF
ncbi:DUF697 domain-containing protein, partial [candidate division KSB3 bacterium]|nr:DUF697 domain-containing protein [candidate division KSB3 bacterium]MBD3323871.1 DUF697 domain-containing protein [candidate division KSB3 bacterium]